MAARRYVLQAVLLHEDIRNLAVQRPLNVRRNDFTDLSEAKFLERYRISKAVTLKVLEEIQERLEYHNQRNYPLSSMHQLLIALRYYASGSFQLVMADNAGVSKATVCRTISKVSAAIGALRPNYINNLQQENIAEIKRGFYDLAHFPGVVGALDCTHIQIQSPGRNRGEAFRNRKGFFSINVQTVCDSKLIIRDIVARWPGSVHDSTIFNNCRLRADFETARINDGVLLGDNGYPLRRYLLTPFLRPQTRAQMNYNRAHKRTRNCVERMYGVWKRRFPALRMTLRIKVRTALKVIIATAVLHNIATEMKDDIPQEDLLLHQYLGQRRMRLRPVNDDVPVLLMAHQEPQTAVGFRNAIAETYFGW